VSRRKDHGATFQRRNRWASGETQHRSCGGEVCLWQMPNPVVFVVSHAAPDGSRMNTRTDVGWLCRKVVVRSGVGLLVIHLSTGAWGT
jgi:hypothetical protein